MKLVPLESIIILDNRQRKEFPQKETEDLCNSIMSKGLMHPIVVRNDGKTLIAGERRLKAITHLYKESSLFTCDNKPVPEGFIPVNMLCELSSLEVQEAELEENTVRLDLTWQDKARALMQLNELRLAQAKNRGEGHSIADLLEEVKGDRSGGQGVRDALILAKHMHIPEVATAKTQKEAVKLLKKAKATEWRAELAAKVDLIKSPHDLRLGSAIDLFPTLGDETFDLIITDPPYGVGADTFGDMASTGHNYKDTWEIARGLYEYTAREGYRVARKQAHCYAFCSFEHFVEISFLFDSYGWEVWPRPLIWNKGNGMLPRPEHGPRYTYECIIFANKGDRRVLAVRSDVISIGGDSKILHGAQKPVDLYTDLIARSCLPGDTILDPFGGTGPVIPAATGAKCTATLFEIDSAHFDICVGRLEQDPLDQIELEL